MSSRISALIKSFGGKKYNVYVRDNSGLTAIKDDITGAEIEVLGWFDGKVKRKVGSEVGEVEEYSETFYTTARLETNNTLTFEIQKTDTERYALKLNEDLHDKGLLKSLGHQTYLCKRIRSKNT